jgi:hypothetical protein
MAGQCHYEAGARSRGLLHPLTVGRAPLLWRDWSRRIHRRACMQLIRHHCVEGLMEQGLSTSSALVPMPLSRAQRAHYRLDFQERLVRNARVLTAPRVTIRLFGILEEFVVSLSLTTV